MDLLRLSPALLIAVVCGCTMVNPAFDGTLGDGGTDEQSGDGEPGDGEPGDGDPGDGEPGDGEPGDGEPGDGDPGCPLGTESCLGECVNTKVDPLNCGGCGVECGAGQGCVDGGCEGPEESARVVFVSSLQMTGAIGGLEAANAMCTELALDAGLDGTFKAWLGVGLDGPAQTFNTAGSFALVDGTKIAEDWIDLTDGSLAHAIDLDETGAPADGGLGCNGGYNTVWTGVSPKGETLVANCNGWTVEDAEGGVGYLNAFNENWTMAPLCAKGCYESLPVYCFEQ